MSDWWSADPVVSGAAPSPQYGNAISSIESGGNYKAIGPATRTGDRAFGKYQVMGNNIGPWSKEILGREVSRQEFINSPEIQDAIFNGKFGRYVEQYGPEGAARAWFAGERGMNNPNARDILGTSVADYSAKFNRALGFSGDAQPQPVARREPQQGAASGNWWANDPVAQPAGAEPDMKELADISANALKPQVSQGRAALEGLLSGTSANFRDEIAGASAASGLPEILGGFRAPIGAARLAYEAYTGQPAEATAAYERRVGDIREVQKAGEEQFPGTTLATNIAGAVASPLNAVLPGAAALRTAPTLAGRAAGAGAVGAGFGAVSGAGEGEGLTDRASRAATGALIGGAAGAVGAPVLEGAVRGAGALASYPVNLVRSAINPNAAAERAVGRAYRDAVQADPAALNRLAPGEVRGPAAVMDTLGSPGRDLARSAANISGGARDVLNDTLNPRFEEQAPRLVNWLRTTFHYPDVHAQQQAIETTARTVNRQAYAQAYRDGARPLWDEGFQQLTAAPVVQDAIRAATRTGANKAAAEGFRPPQNPFNFAADGTMTMREGVQPTLQFWDGVKRNLDDRISTLQRAGENEAARDAIRLRSYLVSHLDEFVPSYGQARAGAAHFFGAENALEAGQRFVTENFAIPQTRAALGRMTANERQLFQDGFVSRLMEQVSNVPDRADVTRRIFNSPNAREKITIALGAPRARELEAMLRVENIMQQSLRGVQGNSTTVQQLIGAGAAGAAGGGFLGFDPTTSGLAAALATAGKKGIDQRVANRVAEMLTSSNPDVLRRGVQMVANNQRFMDLLRRIDSGAAKIAGQESPKGLLPTMQGMATGRAEDEQPNVPRP